MTDHGSLFDNESNHIFSTGYNIGPKGANEIGIGYTYKDGNNYDGTIKYTGFEISGLPKAGEIPEGSNRSIGVSTEIKGGLAGTLVDTDYGYIYGYGEAGIGFSAKETYNREPQDWNPEWGDRVYGFAVTPNGPKYVEVYPDYSIRKTNTKHNYSITPSATIGIGTKNEDSGWSFGVSAGAYTDLLHSKKELGGKFTLETSKDIFDVDGVKGSLGARVGYNTGIRTCNPMNKEGYFGGVSFTIGF